MRAALLPLAAALTVPPQPRMPVALQPRASRLNVFRGIKNILLGVREARRRRRAAAFVDEFEEAAATAQTVTEPTRGVEELLNRVAALESAASSSGRWSRTPSVSGNFVPASYAVARAPSRLSEESKARCLR